MYVQVTEHLVITFFYSSDRVSAKLVVAVRNGSERNIYILSIQLNILKWPRASAIIFRH